ncbi:hypothetical protein HZA87_04460 [Candidatus Uhrbacteria bacterium]|nr:hypothetical protein [Candidatus Uhrbacteria bacterium]
MNQPIDIEQEAKKLGERFALLLAAADMPEDVKAGFIAMMPEMTPEQLDRLMKVLEANVHDTAVGQNKELGEAIQKADRDYQAAQAAAEEKAMSVLDDIEATLKKAEV